MEEGRIKKSGNTYDFIYVQLLICRFSILDKTALVCIEMKEDDFSRTEFI